MITLDDEDVVKLLHRGFVMVTIETECGEDDIEVSIHDPYSKLARKLREFVLQEAP
jgi:hypothetical protein